MTNTISTSNTTVPSNRHQKIVVQASTSELLRCFTSFLSKKCSHLIKPDNGDSNPACFENESKIKADSRDIISWLRSADRALLIQGWQEIAFMNPVNVVFVYLLVRDSLRPEELKCVYDLQCNIMACLYLAFSYMGNEISYPLKPFLIEDDRDLFWERTVSLMSILSGNMLRINQDPRFFTELFYELKSYSVQTSPTVDNIIKSSSILSNNSFHKSHTTNTINSSNYICNKQTQQVLNNSINLTQAQTNSINLKTLKISNLEDIQSSNEPNNLNIISNQIEALTFNNSASQSNCLSTFTRNSFKSNCFTYLTKTEQTNLLQSSILYNSNDGPKPIAYCI